MEIYFIFGSLHTSFKYALHTMQLREKLFTSIIKFASLPFQLVRQWKTLFLVFAIQNVCKTEWLESVS